MIPYTLIRSDRRSVSMTVRRDLTVEVRAPRWLSRREIDAFVCARAGWVQEKQELMRQRAAATDVSEGEIRRLKALARAVLPGRVDYYGRLLGLTPAGITITRTKTRFGSCSAKNRLSFSCFLMQYPPEAIDYVVVHELCHIVHKDHSRAFYDRIAAVLPDHAARRKLLRTPLPV